MAAWAGRPTASGDNGASFRRCGGGLGQFIVQFTAGSGKVIRQEPQKVR